ncbi:MAG TPA: hypothetical protein VH062_03465 [Polyangiaceae bacterium]|nr:hypothetical protein [Polyangiaceae bacterium]
MVASRGATATAGEIIGLAGTGRNTFYEHFDGVDAAVSEVIRTAVRDLGNALHESTAETRAPRERIRSLATAWLAGTAKNPLATAVLLETVSEGRTLLLAELEKELRGALELGRTAGALSVATEPLRVACALGTFVAAATHVARTADVDLRAAADTLTDVTLRSFR